MASTSLRELDSEGGGASPSCQFGARDIPPDLAHPSHPERSEGAITRRMGPSRSLPWAEPGLRVTRGGDHSYRSESPPVSASPTDTPPPAGGTAPRTALPAPPAPRASRAPPARRPE